MKKIIATLIFATLSASVYAEHNIHTWHNVTTQSGTWRGTLKMINQGGGFVDANKNEISTFTISPTQPLKYGFYFDPTDNFDVAYTLTLTQDENTRFTSKTCVFVVTAKGPAQPDIRYMSYHDANCGFSIVHGVGEDFSVA